MKMKKAVSFFLAIAALVVMSACGGDNTPADGSQTADPINTTAETVGGNDAATKPETEEDQSGTISDDPTGDPTYGQYFILAEKLLTVKSFSEEPDKYYKTEYEWTAGSRTTFKDGEQRFYVEFDGDGYYTKVERYDRNGAPELTYVYDRGALPGIVFFERDNVLDAFDYRKDKDSQHIVMSEFDEAGRVTSTTSRGDVYYTYEYQYDENGNVKVLYTEYEYATEIPNYAVEYNEHMKVTRYIEYGYDGRLLRYNTYEYDADGNEIKVFRYDRDGKFEGGTVREYDENGNRTLLETYFNGDESTPYSRYEFEYIYDTDGKLLKEMQYSDGVGRLLAEYEYDAAGNLTKKITYDGAGNVYSVSEYEYDKNGNQIKISGDSYVYSEWEYDDDGNMLMYIEYVIGRKHEYEYDENGHMTRETLYTMTQELPSWYRESTREYDEYGHLIREDEYTQSGRLLSSTEYKWIPATETQYKAEQLIKEHGLDFLIGNESF